MQLLVQIILAASVVVGQEAVFNVAQYGAVADGVTLDTAAIETAVDACHRSGGGRVLVPAGRYLVGTVRLKSNVTLELAAGATLLGSTDKAHYSQRAVVYADGQENIALVGRGVIDGQGGHPVYRPENPYNGLPGRPFLVQTIGCTKLKVEGITLRDGATWAFRCDACDDVFINDLTIHSRVNANNDGIDLVDCQKVRLANCALDCGDDALCLKSESERGCQYITITNCVIKSESNAIKFGTASVGGFRDVAISNCVLHDTRLSGIALEAVDGGAIERVAISNITMRNVNGGIFLRLGKRRGETPSVLRNVVIANVEATGIGCWRPDESAAYYKETRDPLIGLSLAGLPDHPIENVVLRNVRLRFQGGGTTQDAARELEEKPAAYPEYSMFGVTPAYGFYCRHVRSIHFSDVTLESEIADSRPPLFFDDARDITVSGLDAMAGPDACALIRLRRVNGVFLYGSRPRAAETGFLSVDGEQNEGIAIIGNDLSRLKAVVRTPPEMPSDAVFVQGNRPPQ